MKAWVWTNPRTFEMKTIADPAPREDEVVLRVAYAGICGSDLSGYLGENSLRKPPLVMGHEFSGTVVARGSKVRDVDEGALVAVNPFVTCQTCTYCLDGLPQHCQHKSIIGIHRAGAFAEYVAVPASLCYPISDGVAGSLVEPFACSLRSVRQARVDIGNNVVVIGAGAIGVFAALAASWRGANQVIVVDTNKERLNVASQFGATSVVCAGNADLVSEVAEMTGNRVDSVIDAVGLGMTRHQSIAMAKPGARVVWIGLHEDDTSILGNVVVRHETEIVGSFSYDDADFRTAHQSIENKRLVLDESWLGIRPIDDIKACFDEQVDGPATHAKLVFTMS